MAQIKTKLAYGVSGTLATANLADDAITSAKIADNAVVTAAINADAITSAKIADNAVVTAAINGSAVTDAKISAVAATKLSGTIADARFPSTLPALNGSALTALNASNVASGTLNTSRYVQGGGKLLQTQSVLFTSQSAHSSQSYTETGYLDQITPSATNSKIFVQFNFRSHIYTSSGSAIRSRLAIFRQINGGGFSQFYPNTADICWGMGVSSGERSMYTSPTITFLDTTHNTTNAIDYKLAARRDTSSTGTVNVGGSSHQAQVILMEIGA